MINTSPLVSIVIPIYNVELYLDDCLNSLIEQSYQNWQAILVNDGSPDNSIHIAIKFCELDARFKLINQENKGLGGARNAGVEHATGEYLFFLDSDDLITTDALAEMVCLLESNKECDLVIGGLYDFYDDSYSTSKNKLKPNQAYSVLVRKVGNNVVFNEQHVEDVEQLNLYLCIAHSKLFRLPLWNKLKCESPYELRMAEDFIPVKKYLYSCNKVLFLEYAAVQYRNRCDSASKNKSNNAFEVFRSIPLFITQLSQIGHYKNNKASWNEFLFYMVAIHYYFCPVSRRHEYINKIRTMISTIENDNRWCRTLLSLSHNESIFNFVFYVFLSYQYKISPYMRAVKRFLYRCSPKLVRLIKGNKQ